LILLFDFDGVLVDSNYTKTEAFRDIANHLAGAQAAEDLVSFHRANPGLSRFEKLDYLNRKFLQNNQDIEVLAERFGQKVMANLGNLRRSSLIQRLSESSHATPYIVSAAPQVELEGIIDGFGWTPVFKNRVFGSPDSKTAILERVMVKNSEIPAIYIGDSESDYKVASNFGIKFVHIFEWGDWKPSKEIVEKFSESWPTVDDFIESFLLR
jgi:phosphoglycolate phosphatase-like HAD superfamily hydrolase